MSGMNMTISVAQTERKLTKAQRRYIEKYSRDAAAATAKEVRKLNRRVV